MPLPLPKLDTRTWDDLIAEGRSLIPRYAPGWTDHNIHDPGITLIELFAWLVESDLYRLDRTPDAALRAFLRMVGVEPRPAQVAETIVCLHLNAHEPGPTLFDAGIQLGDTSQRAMFETTCAINVWLAQLRAIRAGAPDAENQLTISPGRPGQFFPFGRRPQPDAALYLGFDQPFAALGEVSLYVWTDDPAHDHRERARLIAEYEAQLADAAGCATRIAPVVPSWHEHYSARTVWEYRAGDGSWKPLTQLTDETRALTLSGAVRFAAPPDQSPGLTAVPVDPNYYIRCRLVSGGYECPRAIARIELNAVRATHAVTQPTRQIETSAGIAAQIFRLGEAPIVPGSTQLTLENGTQIESDWYEALDWDRAGPHDRVYRLDPEAGEIIFGDGRHGRIPADGITVHASYRLGSGANGNIGTGILSRVIGWQGQPLVGVALNIEQPFPALGGADAEPLHDAINRALKLRAEPDRAVTPADYERLARTPPGLRIGQVRALAERHKALPCYPAPDCVTLVVVPQCADPQPTPTKGMLCALERYLARRRTIATEVHVVGPRYVTVVVHARLHTEPAVSRRVLAAQAKSELDRFFHPLHGGPDDTGWPVGRDIYRAEVFALLSGLPGVIAVDQLSITVGDAEPYCSNGPLGPECLPVSGAHVINVI